MRLAKFLGSHAEDQFVVICAAGKHHAAQPALKLEAQPLVQPDRALVERVDARRDLLIAQLLEVVRQHQGDGLRCVAFAPVLSGNRQTIAERAVARVAGVRVDRAHRRAVQRLDDPAIGVIFGLRERGFGRELLRALLRARKLDVVAETGDLAVLIPTVEQFPVARFNAAKSDEMALLDVRFGVRGSSA